MHAFQQDASLSSNRLKTSFYSHLTGCHRTFVVFESISFLNNRKNRIKFTFCFYFYSVGKFPALIFNTSNINIAAFRITKSSYFISRYKRFVCQFDNNRKIFTRSSGCHLCYKQTNKNVRTHLLIKTLSEKKTVQMKRISAFKSIAAHIGICLRLRILSIYEKNICCVRYACFFG